ncbi:MAG TPA: hypothetical protein VMI54_01855 [Polyangiaceae bacterium]|nr:hypothetical protein [Polyangiaceae bacterium]
MPWAFVVVCAIYGLLCIVFAFIEPPAPARGLFRVPSIFVFLPDRWVMPVGRLFVGGCALVVAGFLAFKFVGIPGGP